ncbi:DUF29 family protein [Leptolyngbya sp. FACHB-321]|uniref:DUF29 family protein n=1 Tax=Leptolyngbya sp. FACHB-321 TaxID=2692807 RepID=UPI0018EFB230|nr:DUF29 family protein [Leptolyngbya sp. FACHB-321]
MKSKRWDEVKPKSEKQSGCHLEEIFEECYADTVEQAIAKADLPSETFPRSCPYTISATLDSSYLPGSSVADYS